MGSGRVLVVGSVNVDLVVAAPRLPAPGQTVTGGDLVRYHGGKGGNQATAAARLGASVAFVGAVGADSLGSEARSALADEGIDIAGLSEVGRPTGVALIVVDPSAENLIAVAPGANHDLDATHVEWALGRLVPGPGDVVLACREIRSSAVGAAMAAGRRSGAVTILNPAPADDLDRATLAFVDILTPNETELALLAGDGTRGDGPQSAAQRLLELWPSGDGASRGDRATGPAVVVTLGAAGALIVRRGRTSVEIPAPAVDPVDTTGAGDTFNGALADGIADGLDLVHAVRRAVAAAALSTTRAGARAGMPTRAELERFLGGR